MSQKAAPKAAPPPFKDEFLTDSYHLKNKHAGIKHIRLITSSLLTEITLQTPSFHQLLVLKRRTTYGYKICVIDGENGSRLSDLSKQNIITPWLFTQDTPKVCTHFQEQWLSDSARDGHHSYKVTQRQNIPAYCFNENSRHQPYRKVSKACGYKIKYEANRLSLICAFIAPYPLMKGKWLKGSSMQSRLNLISLPVLNFDLYVCSPLVAISYLNTSLK